MPRRPRYLTGDPSGWRFQMRLSPQFFKNGIDARFGLAGAAPMVRAQLGPRSRGEAKRLAVQLATICQTVSAFAADIWKGIPMNPSQIDDRQNELVQHTVAACQNAISRALENPSQAIGLARGLESALTSLQLVEREVAKGAAGAAAVTANAESLTRAALNDVLKLASSPEKARAALAAVEQVGPAVQAAADGAAGARGLGRRRLAPLAAPDHQSRDRAPPRCAAQPLSRPSRKASQPKNSARSGMPFATT
jgi:hypothetical protein